MILSVMTGTDPQGRWTVGTWLLALASGALATSLLRVPVGIAGIGSTALWTHIAVGTVVGALALRAVMRPVPRSSIPPALTIVATLAAGWLAWRSFAPTASAAHAALAALTAVALAADFSRRTRPAMPREAQTTHPWPATVAATGFVLLVMQIVLGALLRHHLTGVGWHLLTAGLAALAVLVPAVSTTQDAHAPAVQKRASVWAITTLLIQIALGVVILLLMVTNSDNATLWLLVTVTHVVAGSVTLLTAWNLARALRQPSDAADRREQVV